MGSDSGFTSRKHLINRMISTGRDAERGEGATERKRDGSYKNLSVGDDDKAKTVNQEAIAPWLSTNQRGRRGCLIANYFVPI